MNVLIYDDSKGSFTHSEGVYIKLNYTVEWYLNFIELSQNHFKGYIDKRPNSSYSVITFQIHTLLLVHIYKSDCSDLEVNGHRWEKSRINIETLMAHF